MQFKRIGWAFMVGLGLVLMAVGLILVLPLGGSSPRNDAPASGASFLDLAARVSVSDAEQGVWFFDYARARDLAGIEQPAPDASQADIRKYAEALSGKVVASSTPVSRFVASSSTDWTKEIGFTFADIDRVLWTVGSSTQPSLAAASGRMQAVKITDALQETSSWSKGVKSAVHKNVSYLTWEKPVPINPLWSAGRMIPGDGVVVWTDDTGMIERSIDVVSDPRLSLTRLPELEQIAKAFDALGVYTAHYNFGLDDSQVTRNRNMVNGEYGRQFVSTQKALERFDSVVVGVGQSGSSAYAVMILVHADEAAAVANAEKLREIVRSGTSFHTRRPWKDVIDKAEFEAVGTLVYGRIYSENLRLTFDAWNNLDSLFLQ